MVCYTDTSVFGGVYDRDFAVDSIAYFKDVDKGLKTLAVSPVVINEISFAPADVRLLFEKYLPNALLYTVTPEVAKLAKQYITENALTGKSVGDAFHIALASVNKADVIASWNFKHIVNLYRIRIFHAVNLKNGYPAIEIRSPKELLSI